MNRRCFRHEGGKQTALGNGGQSLHGDRAVASTACQALLFAELLVNT